MSDLPLVTNLSADRPISSFSEDLLDRKPFADALANAFIQWHGEDSLVAALYGPWGSGKSSVKNMILEMIRRHKNPQRSSRDSGRLLDALKRISAYVSELDMDGASPLISALMDLGDSLPYRTPGLFGIGPDRTAYFIVYEFLKREKDVKEMGRILLEMLVSHGRSLFAPTDRITGWATSREGRTPTTRHSSTMILGLGRGNYALTCSRGVPKTAGCWDRGWAIMFGGGRISRG